MAKTDGRTRNRLPGGEGEACDRVIRTCFQELLAYDLVRLGEIASVCALLSIYVLFLIRARFCLVWRSYARSRQLQTPRTATLCPGSTLLTLAHEGFRTINWPRMGEGDHIAQIWTIASSFLRGRQMRPI